MVKNSPLGAHLSTALKIVDYGLILQLRLVFNMYCLSPKHLIQGQLLIAIDLEI